MITEKQRRDRRGWIGASDVPTIMGANPYATATDLWAEKVGIVEGFKGNAATERGNYLEDGCLRWLSDRIGERVVRASRAMVHPVLPYVRSHADAFVGRAARGQTVVEAKTSAAWSIEDGVPEAAWWQVQTVMACARSRSAYVVALGRDLVFGYARVEYDEEADREIVQRCKRFWHHVITATRPDPDEFGGMSPRVFTAHRPEPTAAAVPEALMEVYRQNKAELDRATELHEACKAKIMALLAEHEVGLCPGWKITAKPHERTSLDTKVIKAERPDIYEKYARTTIVRPLTIKETA